MGNNDMARAYRQGVQRDASAYLIDIVGEKRGRMAAARVGMAFAAAARAAKDPGALYGCSRASIVACIGNSALTNLMPGGANPKVWLVPKGGEMQWWLSHRGIATLALREGYILHPVPVHVDDSITIEFGEAIAHDADPDVWPSTLDEMRGLYLTIKRIADGAVLGRPWLPMVAVHKRRKKAMTQKVWKEWGVAQSQKTIIKWAMSRGLLPIDSDGLNLALSLEPQFIDVEVGESTTTARPTGRAALNLGGGNTDAPQLTDGQPERDLEDADAAAGEQQRRARVPVERKPEPEAGRNGPPQPPIDNYDDEAPE